MTYPTFITSELDFIFTKLGDQNCFIDRITALFLYTIVSATKPNHVLEIGRYQGFSTACLAGALRDLNHGELWSIDISHQCPDWLDDFLRPCHVMTLDSATIMKNTDITKNQYDLFFIDGDHRYAAVLQDLQNTYALSSSCAKWLIDDSDMDDVAAAIKHWISQNNDLIDVGIFNQKIRLVIKSA